MSDESGISFDKGGEPAGTLSRRDFLRAGAAAAAALGAAASVLGAAGRLVAQEAPDAAESPPAATPDGPPAASPAAPGPAASDADRPSRSRVVVVTHPEALVREYVANRSALEQMIERAVRELTGADSAEKAWRSIAADGDRVSMKMTRAGGPELRTHEEVGAYVARRLAEAARVAPDRIRIWDRSDLAPAELELSDPFVLPSRNKETRLRAALVRDTTCIVNLPVLKMHSGTGASIALKNHFGSINNPSAFHGWDRGEMWKSIAELNHLEPIRTRTRLVLCDATRPLYDGGPSDKPECRWTFGGIIAGTDPVAVESVGLDILEKKRRDVRGAPWPAADGRKVIEWAGKVGLGQGGPARIDLVTIRLD